MADRQRSLRIGYDAIHITTMSRGNRDLSILFVHELDAFSHTGQLVPWDGSPR